MGVAWKDLEREVARRLDGTRVVREQWDKRDCDIRHSYYSIECKLRADIGVFYNEELDLMRKVDRSRVCDSKHEVSRFIMEAMSQARSYNGIKPAMVVLKRKGIAYDDSLVFMFVKDFPQSQVRHVILFPLAFTGLKEFTAYWQVNKYSLVEKPDPYRYES